MFEDENSVIIDIPEQQKTDLLEVIKELQSGSLHSTCSVIKKFLKAEFKIIYEHPLYGKYRKYNMRKLQAILNGLVDQNLIKYVEGKGYCLIDFGSERKYPKKVYIKNSNICSSYESQTDNYEKYQYPPGGCKKDYEDTDSLEDYWKEYHQHDGTYDNESVYYDDDCYEFGN